MKIRYSSHIGEFQLAIRRTSDCDIIGARSLVLEFLRAWSYRPCSIPSSGECWRCPTARVPPGVLHAAVETDIRASQGFTISLLFSTQLQHRQTTTNIDAVYIIVSASASSIQ
jgi:hypothetical protein